MKKSLLIRALFIGLLLISATVLIFSLTYWLGKPKNVPITSLPPKPTPIVSAVIEVSPSPTAVVPTPNPFVACVDCRGYTSLAEALKNPEKVAMLTLNDPTMTAVPPSVGTLTQLFVLNIGNTKITTLPAQINQLTNLQTLLLSNNQITSLPDAIKELKNLKLVHLDGNPIAPAEQARIRQLLPQATIVFSFSQVSPTPTTVP